MSQTGRATIFALASGAGRAGVAVLRLSGPGAGGALLALSGRPAMPRARVATRVRLRAPASGEPFDDGLALWFPAPASYTGEDVVELHLHGGRAVLEAALAALAAQPGLRPAEPGEFTRRAFEHGKMDLTAAEAIADLVDAETAAQRRQALRQLDGALGALYEDWRGRLLGALAHVEAEIDFPDEDLPGGLLDAVRPDLERLRSEITAHLADNRRGERLRDGLSVAILGPPNAGKSSLLNVLARQEAAIVSERAGTTRDVIEVALDLGGWPVVLADTAGIRDETDDPIEREGIRRAERRAATADLRIVVLDAAAAEPPSAAIAGLLGADALVVWNKADAAGPGFRPPLEGHLLSARTGAGLEEFLAALQAAVEARLAGVGAAPALTRLRHRQALEDAAASIMRSFAAAAPELAAEDLRLAARALGRITGRVSVEDMLDVIFRDFCIGK